MKKDQNGFSVVMLLIVLLIVGLVVAVGWLVMDRRENNITKDQKMTTKQPLADKKDVMSSNEPAQEKTTNTQYVNGASFELPLSMGSLLQENTTSEIVNLSSAVLLAKEKELYGDDGLQCTAVSHPLGAISVRDDSGPLAGFDNIKKISSGKYLSYNDVAKASLCYLNREKLHSLIEEQVSEIKKALIEAK